MGTVTEIETAVEKLARRSCASLTLSPTAARVNLSSLLKRAIKGEDIGIVCEGAVVALRPVAIHSADYALAEYGTTPDEMPRIAARLSVRAARARRAGKSRPFRGRLDATLGA